MGNKKVRSGAQRRNQIKMREYNDNEDWEDDEVITSTINLSLDGEQNEDQINSMV